MLHLVLIATRAAWAVDVQIPHQGRVLDPAGTPRDDVAALTLRLWPDATTTDGGDLLFEQSFTVSFEDGYYDVVLGSGGAHLDSALFARPEVWLGVSVAGDVLEPRTRLHAVPYAVHAGGVTLADNGGTCGTEVADGTLRWTGIALEICSAARGAWIPVAGGKDGSSQDVAAETCQAIYDVFPTSPDGQYWIDPNSASTSDALLVYCDFDPATGSGWTRIQLYGGRRSQVASFADCSNENYGTNQYLGGGHRSVCDGSEVLVTWRDDRDVDIPTSQVTAMYDLGMTSRPSAQWMRDPDGNLDDVKTCWGSTELQSWRWTVAGSASSTCYETTNTLTTRIFDQWSASTGSDDSGQDWYLDRYWFFR